MSAKKIEKIYFNAKHPAGFGTFASLRKYLGPEVKNNDIKSFLMKQESYTLHAPRVKKFKRDFVFVTNIDDVWGIDLIDFRNLKAVNNNFSFLLCVIDVLSKYAWVKCLKNKTGENVKFALEQIIEESGRQPLKIHCDKGKEFVNLDFKNYLQNKGIEMYHTENSDIKVSVCERFIKTFKTKLWRYFTYNNSKRYVDIYQDILSSYNDSYHSSIGDAPSNVNEKNFLQTWRKLYNNKLNIPGLKAKYKQGDHVRISKERHVFSKGYTGNWSLEIFEITNVIHRRPILYELIDLNQEKILGRFYEKELRKVYLPSHHKIDKILKTRKNGSTLQYLVSWEGYPSSFNSWISEKDFK